MSYYQQQPYVEEEYRTEAFERERIYATPPPPSSAYTGERTYERVNSNFYEGCERGRYQHNERLGELGTVATGAFALYEEHKAKTDPIKASKHKTEAEIAALGTLGSAGYAYHEHRQKEKFEDGRW